MTTLRPLLVATLLLSVSAAWAQQTAVALPAGQRCLTPTATQAGVPEYPLLAWKANQAGRVKVELVFTAADKPPRVKVLEEQGGDNTQAFVEVVRKHVVQYRVPCLEDRESPSLLHLEFVFKPDERKVTLASPAPPEAAELAAMSRCMVHASGQKQPRYPSVLARKEMRGRVLVWLQFETDDSPPRAELRAPASLAFFKEAVEDWVRGLRLPCHRGNLPVELSQEYVFRMEGDQPFGLPDLMLVEFLRCVDGIERQTAAFDTHPMGCPFDLRFIYRQPVMENSVRQLGNYNPAREPLQTWLRTLDLKLREAIKNVLFGDTFAISVPCIKIDLKPKE